MTAPDPLFLTIDDVIALHTDLIRRFGGDTGLRDPGLLESAIAQPRMTAFGSLLHEDRAAQAAAYLFHLVANHPFLDGNKRIGLHACQVFLAINRTEILGDWPAWLDITMAVARSEAGKPAVIAFVRSHIGPNP